ncbi:MAG: hypothetical protein Kow0080_07180 [Candidatus Promineifilaceae bacterium]
MNTKWLLTILFLASFITACIPTTQPATVLDDTDRLAGTTWQLVEYGSPDNPQRPLPGTQITLTFQDGQAGGSTSCNSYGGSYTLNGSQLTFGEMAMTTMECVDEAIMTQENDYIALLASAPSFQIRLGSQNGLDTLILTSTQGTLTFEELKPLSLEGIQWQLHGLANGSDAVVSTWVDEQITLLFADGTLSGSAGCNNYNGRYQLDGTQLTIGPLAATKMACEPERNEREQQFLTALQKTASFNATHSTITFYDKNGRFLLTIQPIPQKDEALYGRVWEVVALETADGPLPTQPNTSITAQFIDDIIWGDGGCNRYTAPFHIAPANFLLLVGTVDKGQQTCETAVQQTEETYFTLLSNVESYALESERLTLYTPNGQISLTPMGYTTYAPPFVALRDGTRCSRTAVDDPVAVNGLPRTYFCSQSGQTMQALIGPLTPTENGWLANLTQLSGSNGSFTAADILEVMVTLPQP